MTRNLTAQKIARRTGLVAALASLALAVAPAASIASAPVKFGAMLNPTVQPSNSLPGLTCNGPETPLVGCTMILNEAYGRPDGGELAPKTGTIKKIRLIAGGPGSFRLQVAKVNRATVFGTNEARAVHYGPQIHYEGQTEANFEDDSYRVESFPVSIPVKKGQQLALRGQITSMIRCSSGGDHTLIYTPPLYLGGPFTQATNTDGCWLLMEAVIR
ncbi:MAG TPA: hypothetical protein VGN84_05895 [Solirubrobacterales bacterium]|jgi:hypothetical protein|nr:hypothetical protein [Solirubrobacterales bacterium]